ncbi:YlzJ-like protein [Laceyella sediminis]|uniref:YlzJ-like protein n=1 Tax=Laceyella sediminis TaxID=573074 RepID=A0ABX5EQF2_9BACL|nr:YlzJ-like family protein [Laceyella sediminis]PRZ15511.1 YlzJ-like protein [Laceyella sediminis]
MIYYAVVPMELAFFDESQTPLEEVEVEGVPMLVRKHNEQEKTIVRLLSADPAHYLDPRFQPGLRISL